MSDKNSGREDVYKTVYGKIVTGEYPSGYRLIEADLAREFQVSRTPVRLAIERLVSEGLAKHIPNKGALVRQMSIDDILSLYSIREVNEGLAARLACRNAKPEDSVNLNDILKAMDEAEEIKEYYRLCTAIHTYIFQMTKNEFLCDFINRIYSITSRFHIAVLCFPGRSDRSKEEHKQLVKAILSGDEDFAEKVMREHIKHSASFYEDANVRSSLNNLSGINWK